MQAYEWWYVGIYALGFFCLWITWVGAKEWWYWTKATRELNKLNKRFK